MRVNYGGKLFDIYSVIDSKEQHRELQLMCKEGEAHNGYHFVDVELFTHAIFMTNASVASLLYIY